MFMPIWICLDIFVHTHTHTLYPWYVLTLAMLTVIQIGRWNLKDVTVTLLLLGKCTPTWCLLTYIHVVNIVLHIYSNLCYELFFIIFLVLNFDFICFINILFLDFYFLVLESFKNGSKQNVCLHAAIFFSNCLVVIFDDSVTLY